MERITTVDFGLFPVEAHGPILPIEYSFSTLGV
jgi:hypothetical protein